MFQRILVCTEFTDGLGRLVDFVEDFAVAGIKQIVFLHAVPLQESRVIPQVDRQKVAAAEARLSRALERVPQDVEVKVEIDSGKAVEVILKAAKTYQTELIILGTESRTFLTEKLFGSTLMELSRRTTIPFLVLRPQLISTYRVEELRLRCQQLFQYLLIPYNGSQSAKFLLERVKTAIKSCPNQVTESCLVCWIVSDGGRREVPKEPMLEQARSELVPIQAELEQLNLQVKTEVELGDPISTILHIADREDISAIVLTSDASSQRLEWLIASFAGEVLRRSLHPILFFPFS